jgi:general nucleoside transport system permease protein
MDLNLLIAIGAAAIRSGTPILIPCLGGIITERSGVLTLGTEGMMLVGALSGFAAAHATGSAALGLAAACGVGAGFALIHAVLSVSFRANQVVSGLALVLFATGVSGLFGRPYVGQPIAGLKPLAVPLLGDLPILGPVLFRHDAVVYASYLLAPAAWLFLHKTWGGLHLRAVGESPETADAMGISVAATRYAATLAGGALIGLGGAYLSLVYTPLWIEHMSAGRGWIAIALVIFARWNPLRAFGGAYLFGGIDALQLRIQAAGSAISPHLLLALPYLATILVLGLAESPRARRRLGIPAALGLPYAREERR